MWSSCTNTFDILNFVYCFTMRLLILCLFSFSVFYCSAQPGIQWQRSFGGSANDAAYTVENTPDGGYITAGQIYSNNGDVTTFYGYADCWIVKLTSSGAMQWQKSLGGGLEDEIRSIKPTSDGGYIAIGNSLSNDGDVSGHHGSSSSSDVWVVKLDANGAIQWQKSLGGSDEDRAYSVQITPDEGYVIAGMTYSNDGDVIGHQSNGINADVWIVKLSSAGTLLWQKCLGGTGLDKANSIKNTSDGGFIVAGYTSSNDGDVYVNHSNISSDFWVIKLSPSGDIQWQKCLGGSDDEVAMSVETSDDGGYLIGGYTYSNDGDVTGNHNTDGLESDYWLVKLNATGNIQWQHCYGGTASEYGNALYKNPDGSYAFCGYTMSTDGNITSNHGAGDIWVLVVDNNGGIIWQRAFGGTSMEMGFDIRGTGDGGYIFAGFSGSNNGDVTTNHGSNDFWVVKLGPASTYVPTITVQASPPTQCAGTPVTFTASITSGGSAPLYRWFKNGIAVGTNSPVYTLTNPVEGEQVNCLLTSNSPNAFPATVASNIITISFSGSPGLITTVAGNGTAGFSGDGGLATSATLREPYGVCVDAAGNIYIADYENNRIRKVAAGTGVITTIAGTGTAGFSGDGGAALNAQLKRPFSVCLDLSGNLLFSDAGNNRVRKINLATGFITTVAGSGIAGFGGDGGQATAAFLRNPSGICIDPAGNIYIADQDNNRVRKISVSTGIISTIAGNGAAGSNGDGGPASGASLNLPVSVAVDLAGNLYIAEANLRKVDNNTGTISTIAGNNNLAISPDGVPALNSSLFYLRDVKVDALGAIYFSEGSNKVRKISATTGLLSTIAGNGSSTFSGDGGPAPASSLNWPIGIALDPAGNVLIADRANQRIRKVSFPLFTPASAPVVNPPSSVCAGTPVTLTITSGTLHSSEAWKWYSDFCGGQLVGTGASITVAPAATTIYFVRGEGNCGLPGPCTSVTVTVNNPLPSSLTISSLPSGLICPNTSVTFTAVPVNGGSAPAFVWKKNGTVVGSNASTYTTNNLSNNDVITCELTSNGNCVFPTTAASNSITVTVDPNPVLGSISPASADICSGSSQVLTATGGGSYQWLLNGTPITGATGNSYTASQSGTYNVLISNGSCSSLAADPVIVTVHPLPSGNITPANASICAGSSQLLTANGGNSYQWYRDNILLPNAVSSTYLATAPGNYSVSISDGFCSATASNHAVLMIATTRPNLRYPTVRVAANRPYILQAITFGTDYLWTPSIGLNNNSISNPVVSISQNRTYTVKISAATICPVVDTVLVEVFDRSGIYVPGAFSPDGNGKNDRLWPIPVHIKNLVSFRVWNRWGELIYQTSTIGEGWDGSFKGKKQPQGVYVWTWEAIDIDGQTITGKGTTVLIR